jgi:Fe-S-cluster-containing hydrogenase component 2
MKVDKNVCVGCGACVGVCPVGAISLKNGVSVIDPKKCIKCGACMGMCPVGAITPND